MWSLYPFIVRDIAVWVPEGTEAEKLRDIYKEFGTELLQGEPKLVDTFTKDGKISYAFRLIFQSYDKTLTDEEINAIMSKITEKISSLGFEVR
jgi:phenylalanyl-tRNA synthetase beta subunit